MKVLLTALAVGTAALVGCATPATPSSEIETMKQQLAAVAGTRATEQANLTNFDDLDFNVYSGQKWELLGQSHSKDIVVHYPDGHTTRGLADHIEELKPQFKFAPNTTIKEHPIRIASGEWTAVTCILEGTFTRSMDMGGGKLAAPTGNSFKLQMVTIGHWKGGVMDEEWLMWDNASFMKQIGLAP